MGFFTPQQPTKEEPGATLAPKPDPRPESVASPAPAPGAARRVEGPVMAPPPPALQAQPKGAESLVATGLSIEGKIEGTGDVRIAGRFKGTVTIQGEFRIEPGASIEGEVRADTVLVGGEVNGKILAAARVDLKESGSFIGDLTAGSLTVAAGSKMRGTVECGWKEGEGLASKAHGLSPSR